MSASNASIQEAARLAAAFGVAFSPNAKIAGQLTANVHAQGPTDHLALNGNVNGRNLEVTGKHIPQPVQVPAIDLTMTPQQIQSNNFTATSGATTLGGADDDLAVHQQFAQCRCDPEDHQRQSG